jgi:polyphenol oxidase
MRSDEAVFAERFFTSVDEGNLALHVGDEATDVLARRASLAASLGVSPEKVQWMKQVHGDSISVAPTPDTPTADALITNEVNLPLAVMVADCIPLLLSDENAGVIAAVHVGRAGILNQVALKTTERMAQMGARHLSAHLGPSICGACYAVPASMQEEVLAVAPASYATTHEGEPALDLSGGLAAMLSAIGVRVSRSLVCTRESPQYFSYRRAAVTGRFAGVITLREKRR